MNLPSAIGIVAMMLLSISITAHALTNPGCFKEPSYLDSMSKHVLCSPTHESLNNLPGLRPVLPIAPNQIDKTFVNIIRVYFGGFQTCPSMPNASHPDLNARSTCPHRWMTNYDMNRIPRLVAEVECSCGNCLEFAPDDRQTQNVCQPVYSYINALRRVGCNGQFYQYAHVVEKIKTACTCAHPFGEVSGGSNYNGPTSSP